MVTFTTQPQMFSKAVRPWLFDYSGCSVIVIVLGTVVPPLVIGCSKAASPVYRSAIFTSLLLPWVMGVYFP